MNRLARERSPYLLQHARESRRLVSLERRSVREGARGGQADLSLDRLLDLPLVPRDGARVVRERRRRRPCSTSTSSSIKVDREERPDVDRVYMTFVQATTGSGGWPMSVWLTPELKPFYGGTYFPPSSKWGRPGFVDILGEIARVWKAERGKVVESAEALTKRLKSMEQAAPVWTVPTAEALDRTVKQFLDAFDPRNGGFGDAPKFPRPSELLFLLREHARTGHAPARDMVLRTLRAMALGGMRDHIGGGFHRYSVDAGWRVPHFEKMLYDQAQLVLALIEGAQVSGDPFYAEVAEDTLLYVMREMTDPGGGVLFGRRRRQHAAGGRRRGRTRTRRKARSISGAPTSSTSCSATTRASSSCGSASSRTATRRRIRSRSSPARTCSTSRDRSTRSRSRPGSPADEVVEILNRARMRMFKERLDRPRPYRDDKILTAWNGLMIAAFARMARVFRGLGGDGRAAGEPYLEAARRAAAFIRERMWNARHRHAAAPLSRRPRRDRGLRRRLRLSDRRPARAVSGRPRADVARVGDRAAAPAGRAVLGRGGGRLVQHHRQGSERAAADEGGLRRRRADGELGVGAQPAGAVAPGARSARGPIASSGRSGCSARGSSRWAAACR